MLGHMRVLVDTTGDKVYVDVWVLVFLALCLALLVWDHVRRP